MGRYYRLHTYINNNIWFGYCFCPTLDGCLKCFPLMLTALLLKIRNVDDAGDVIPASPGKDQSVCVDMNSTVPKPHRPERERGSHL